MTPALSDYMNLIQGYLNEVVTVEEFERVYLRMFKDDATIRPGAEYDVLNGLFSDVDAYCGDPEIRSADDLDDAALRSRASGALRRLETIIRAATVERPST